MDPFISGFKLLCIIWAVCNVISGITDIHTSDGYSILAETGMLIVHTLRVICEGECVLAQNRYIDLLKHGRLVNKVNIAGDTIILVCPYQSDIFANFCLDGLIAASMKICVNVHEILKQILQLSPITCSQFLKHVVLFLI